MLNGQLEYSTPFFSVVKFRQHLMRNMNLVTFFFQVSPSQSFNSLEHNNRVFGRFRTRHHRSSSTGDESLSCSTVELQTSTIKIDAEDTDLRLCFRIISPVKTFTLQVTL